MKRMVRLIQVLFPLALLTAGIGYALYIHEGYARGQREYADLQDELLILSAVNMAGRLRLSMKRQKLSTRMISGKRKRRTPCKKKECGNL
jgi:hypothetical protein